MCGNLKNGIPITDGEPITQSIIDRFCEIDDRLRKSSRSRWPQTQPVTPRSLETIIRLSTAHAKARMSKSVLMEDAEAAMDLVYFAYFKKVRPVFCRRLGNTAGLRTEISVGTQNTNVYGRDTCFTTYSNNNVSL